MSAEFTSIAAGIFIGSSIGLAEAEVMWRVAYGPVHDLGGPDGSKQITHEQIMETVQEGRKTEKLIRCIEAFDSLAALAVLGFALSTHQEGLTAASGVYLTVKAGDWIRLSQAHKKALRAGQPGKFRPTPKE